MKIEKSILGIAGEFAVATELCRRNIYAQLTLGNLKRVDLLTLSNTGRFLKIEVKTKQGPSWPSVKGLSRQDAFLVLVDFEGKNNTERPDFYVLSSEDWCAVAKDHIENYLAKHPGRTAHVDADCCPIFPEELNRAGKPYSGCSVRVTEVNGYRDAWSKIEEVSARVTDIISAGLE